MKTAKKRVAKQKHPKHKQTKKYLKTYYPFLPLLASIGFLLMVLLSPIRQSQQDVLAYATNISPASLLEETNTQRIASGSPALTINPKLTSAAQNKANDMAKRNYWAHKTPEGNNPWVFIDKAEYTYIKAGENLAYGFSDSSSTVTGWMNSPSHRKNLLDQDFKDVGFGVADSANFNSSGASTIVVALYANPMPQTATTQSTNSTTNHTLGEGMTIREANIFTGASWSVYLVGAVIGAAVTYLATVHGNGLRKKLRKGEKFVINHPLLDSAVISLIAIGVLLLRTAGTIL